MLRQITPAQVIFLGRETELNRLTGIAATQKIIVIGGIGGIGKSALAMHLAFQLNQTDFKDRVLFYTCKSECSRLEFFTEIQEEIRKLAGKSQNITAQSDYLFDLIEAQRLCLFLDDFHLLEEPSAWIVRKALSTLSQGRLVLVTRKKISLSPLELVDVFEMQLSGLKTAQSDIFIQQILKVHDLSLPPETISAVSSNLDGHPLSIKLFMGILLTGGHSLENLLNPASEFYDKIGEFLLNQIFQDLNQEQLHLVYILSLARLPLKMNYPGKPEAEQLRFLRKHYIIETDASGAYFIHGLIKDYVAARLKPGLELKLQLEIADRLSQKKSIELSDVRESCYHYLKARKIVRAVEVLLDFSRNFLFLAEEADSYFTLLEDLLSKCGQHRRQDLLKEKISLLIYWNKLDEADKLISEITDQATELFLAGKIALKKGKPLDAFASYSKAGKHNPGEWLSAEIHANLATCAVLMNNPEKAEACFQKAVEIAARNSFHLLKARILLNFSTQLVIFGKPDQAFSCCLSSVDIYRKCLSTPQLATALCLLSELYLDRRDFKNCLLCLTELKTLTEKMTDKYLYTYSFYLEAEISFLEGDFHKALTLKLKALELAEKYGISRTVALIYCDLGRIYSRLRNFPKAESGFKKSLELFEQINHPLSRAYAEQEYGQHLVSCGKLSRALDIFTKISDFARGNDPELYSKALFFQSRTLVQLGRTGESEESAKLFELEFARLPEQISARLSPEFQWYKSAFLKAGSKLTVLSPQGKRIVSAAEDFANQVETAESEIFIDFAAKILRVDGNKIPFFKKNILVSLLFNLAQKPGKIISPREIFQSVWGRNYENASDAANLRMNISRLRRILDKRQDRFIKSALEEQGYFFDQNCGYLVIFQEE
ncbi:MAG: tetratricopeptide repeat protein [Candidatus Wallbacteria bacterium]|nr:tetratricopeptide repeat protein [Candidatus Wallbacteria bacterium]